MNQKMYVLVRKDLPGAQPAVQAGHALAEYLLKYPDCGWTNGTLIYLGVDDEWDLWHWDNKLEDQKVEYVYFEEPDIGEEMTAIAVFDYPEYKLEELFKDLPLL